MLRGPSFATVLMRLALLLLSTLWLVGCNFVYKVDVPQGNLIEQARVDLLRPGMTKRQVTIALGTAPITSVFHANRWDYVYYLRKREQITERKDLTLYFENDVLVRIEGDYAPGATPAAG